jgi:hypothetical protein
MLKRGRLRDYPWTLPRVAFWAVRIPTIPLVLPLELWCVRREWQHQAAADAATAAGAPGFTVHGRQYLFWRPGDILEREKLDSPTRLSNSFTRRSQGSSRLSR